MDKPEIKTISYAGWPNNWIVTVEGVKMALKIYPELRNSFENGLYFIKEDKKEFI